MASGAENRLHKFLREILEQKEFEELKTPCENEIHYARLLYNFKPGRDAIEKYIQQLEPVKPCNAEESEKLRKEANILYRENKGLEAAAILYTKAICKAPTGSLTLARAHANRASVLYKMQYYKAAYEDCTFALQCQGVSPSSILPRQAIIAWKMKDRSKMRDCIQICKDYSVPIPVSIQRLYRELEKEIFPTKEYEKKTNEEFPAFKKIVFEEKTNEEFPAFKKIKLIRRVDQGRYFVADETIEPNELIITDTPYVFLPYKYGCIQTEFSTTDRTDIPFICDNCAENDIIPFPCYECRTVFYCSNKCLLEHYPIHHYECRGYQLSLFKDLPSEHLSLRCLVTSFEGILSKLQDSGAQSLETLWAILQKTQQDSELFSKRTNFPCAQKYSRHLYWGMNTFLVFYYLLHHTDFFTEARENLLKIMQSETEWNIFVLTLLLHFTSVVITNAMGCYHIVARIPFAERLYTTKRLFNTVIPESTTFGVFPWLSFFNHSCYGNVVTQKNNSQVSFISARRIEKGDAITMDYIYDSARVLRDQRRRRMTKYFDFFCMCERCSLEEDSIYMKATSIPCECGGNCILTKELNPCHKCGNVSPQKIYYESIMSSSKLDDTSDTFIYLYAMFSMLKKSLVKQGINILSSSAKTILEKYLLTESNETLNDEHVYYFMVKLGMDLLDITENEYFPKPESARHLVMVLDLLLMRKKFQNFDFTPEYENILQRKFQTLVTGKAKKLFDDVYKAIKFG